MCLELLVYGVSENNSWLCAICWLTLKNFANQLPGLIGEVNICLEFTIASSSPMHP